MIAPQHSKHHSPPADSVYHRSEAVPAELKQRPQWVVWRSELRNGKPTKVPYNPETDRQASSTDLLTWRAFEVALEALRTGAWDGIGFMFCSGDPYTGIDLDQCRDPMTGDLTPEVREIVDTFEGAYMEVSPSGRGIHIIAKSKLTGDRNRRGGIEVYSQERFFTVSGVVL